MTREPARCGRQAQSGSSTLEYASLIALVVVALIAMAAYSYRAVCGNFRAAGDGFAQGRQYEQGWTVEF